MPWEVISTLKLWELAAWGYAASRIDGVEKAQMTSAIAIAFGSIDKEASKKIQDQWDVSDLFSRRDSSQGKKSTATSNGQSKQSSWDDLVGFFGSISSQL